VETDYRWRSPAAMVNLSDILQDMELDPNTRKLKQRILGLSAVESALSQSLNTVVRSYSGSKFRDSDLDKSEFFNQCLNLELSTHSQQMIIDRCSLKFHKDARSSLEYGLELVYGWLSEDLVMHSLQDMGFEVSLMGKDKSREFLAESEIATDSDLLISMNGHSRKLEIVFSWNGTWARSNIWDLRDSKYRKLTTKGNESLCLGFEFPSKMGFLMDMSKPEKPFVLIKNPAWGNKLVYSYFGMSEILNPIDLLFNALTSNMKAI